MRSWWVFFYLGRGRCVLGCYVFRVYFGEGFGEGSYGWSKWGEGIWREGDGMRVVGRGLWGEVREGVWFDFRCKGKLKVCVELRWDMILFLFS